MQEQTYRDHRIYHDPETQCWEISGRYFSDWQFETPQLAKRFIDMRADQDENPEGRPRLPKISRTEVLEFLGAEEFVCA